MLDVVGVSGVDEEGNSCTGTKPFYARSLGPKVGQISGFSGHRLNVKLKMGRAKAAFTNKSEPN